ncbi:hypothetical protein D3C87_1583900 [compost metagenome]
MHVAKQQVDGCGLGGGIRGIAAPHGPRVLGQIALAAGHEAFEFRRLQRQDFANDGQLALLRTGRQRQLAQLGDIAHAQQQAHHRAVFGGDRRPAQVQYLAGATSELALDLGRQKMAVELEVHHVLAQAGRQRGRHLGARVLAQRAVLEHQLHGVAPGNVAGLENAL